MFGLPPPPRFGLFAARPTPAKPHPLLLKAQKNFDLSTACIPLLCSGKHKKLNGKTTKLLLSQQMKKKPFSTMALDLKNCAFSKVISRNVRSFSSSSSPKPFPKLLKLMTYSYKHLEQLDAKDIDIQNKSSLSSIAKLNHLQNLNLKLTTDKYLLSHRFFENLKHLRHITFSIIEATQSKETDLLTLDRFLRSLTLLPLLESYNVEISTRSLKNLVETVLFSLNLLKAKRFSIKIKCLDDIELKVETLTSLLENIDTLEYRYSDASQQIDFQAPTSKKLVLFLNPLQIKLPLAEIVNACTSLQNLYYEQNPNPSQLTAFKLPQTLKTLTFQVSKSQPPEKLKFWENTLSNLNNLENLNLLLYEPDETIEEWVSQLPQRVSFKSLKQYHLELEVDVNGSSKAEYDNFLTEWSRGLRSLSTLEGLSFKGYYIKLNSLNFFTETIASLPKLKTINLKVSLHREQPSGALGLAIPSQNLPSLKHIWLSTAHWVSEDSAVQLLRDLPNCENLESFIVSGLNFEAEAAISALEKLTRLKTLEIGTYKRLTSDQEAAISSLKGLSRLHALKTATSTKFTLRLNSKREFVLGNRAKNLF